MVKALNDPLLICAKVIVWLCIIGAGFAAIGGLVGMPLVFALRGTLLSAFAEGGLHVSGSVVWAFVAIAFGIAVMAAIALYFFILLNRIINSVGDGDPFDPANGKRLAHMGWLALVGQLVALPIGAVIVWLGTTLKHLDKSVHFQSDLGISGQGILLVLILFILARVFRHGAAMREDLEGTV